MMWLASAQNNPELALQTSPKQLACIDNHNNMLHEFSKPLKTIKFHRIAPYP